MIYIPRILENVIKERLLTGKIIIIYGARQVGKTTLVKKILSDYQGKGKYLNCELLPVQEGLAKHDPDAIKAFFGDYELIILDEAQNIQDIGKKLKILYDSIPGLQIIATGSSSFELAHNVSESLAGRSYTFTLHPISLQELRCMHDLFWIESKLEHFLRFGLYPEIINLDELSSREYLIQLASSYLYKDVLKFENIKKSGIMQKLLQLLALQIGNQVSYHELSQSLGINHVTVQKYIDILEQAFVIFRLHSFSRNVRKEISKSVKIYFYDLGIRNALINNFNVPAIRSDTGALWENFCIVERKKFNDYAMRFPNIYFWRTYTQKEVDYVEEIDGNITGYEFKWSGKTKKSIPKDFIENYNAKVETIDKNNYFTFLINYQRGP